MTKEQRASATATRVHTFMRADVLVTDDYYATCLRVAAYALTMNGFTDVAVASDGTFLVGEDLTGPMLGIVQAVEPEDFDMRVAEAEEGLYLDEGLALGMSVLRYADYARIAPESVRPDFIVACKDDDRVRVKHLRGVMHNDSINMLASRVQVTGQDIEMLPCASQPDLSEREATCRRAAEDALAMAGFRLEGQFDDAGLTFAHDGDEVVIVVAQPVSPDCCEDVAEVIDTIKAGPTMAEADSLVAFYAERHGLNADDIRRDFVIVSVDGEQERLTHVVDALGDAVVHDGIAPTARTAARHRHL